MRRAKRGQYASGAEAKHAAHLTALSLSGEVVRWAYEPFTAALTVNGVTVSHYTPDFSVTFADGREEVHEVKGFWRPYDKLRVKLYLALNPHVTYRVIGAQMDRRKLRAKKPRAPA